MNVRAHFIDGAFVDSTSEQALSVVNPSTRGPLRSIPAGTDSDVNTAVASSRRAFDDGRWSKLAPAVRKRTLWRFADAISAAAPELDKLDAEEMGKPIQTSYCDAKAASEFLRFCSEAIDKLDGDAVVSDKNSLVLQRRVPRGVIAAIVPWNFPTFNALLKVASALAAGNAVILKPSELSPGSALRIGQIAIQAGLPPGILNVLLGAGELAGRLLALHPDVDMVAFTGSTTVGKLMLQYAGASNMKPVLAECGGKCPHIIFDDGIDLSSVAEVVASGILTNQGQICSVGSRVLVQRSVQATVVAALEKCLQRAVIGDATDSSTTFGPLASAEQRRRVLGFINEAVKGGIRLVTGGGHPVKGEREGYFVQPTIFADVPPLARIAQEEIFGPVLTVIPFEDEAEAFRIANGTVYGLGAYVWTSQLARGLRSADAIRSAVVVNATVPKGEGAGHACPLEPAGQSGLGVEGGVAGIESFMRRQPIWFNYV